jgi:hypothetical protein
MQKGAYKVPNKEHGKLIYGRNLRRIEFDELKQILLPSIGERFTPIAHHDLIQIAKHYLKIHGFTVDHEEIAVSIGYNGEQNVQAAKMFCVLEVSSIIPYPVDYRPVIGIVNANDKRLSARILAGCSILPHNVVIFTGEESIRRRHTINLLERLPEDIERICKRIPGLLQLQTDRLYAYENAPISDDRYHDLVSRLYMGGFLNTQQLGLAIRTWHRHANEDNRDTYQAFKALALCFRRSNMFRRLKKSLELYKICDKLCGGNNLTDIVPHYAQIMGNDERGNHYERNSG